MDKRIISLIVALFVLFNAGNIKERKFINENNNLVNWYVQQRVLSKEDEELIEKISKSLNIAPDNLLLHLMALDLEHYKYTSVGIREIAKNKEKMEKALKMNEKEWTKLYNLWKKMNRAKTSKRYIKDWEKKEWIEYNLKEIERMLKQKNQPIKNYERKVRPKKKIKFLRRRYA